MNKYKQCMYTVILILTCLVASPFIIMQIWENSSLKQAKAQKKEPVVTTTVTETATTAVTTVSDNETTATEAVEEPSTEPVKVFGTSDRSYFDDALFIGDSRTVGIKEYGTLGNADYFCSVGLASNKVGERLDGFTLEEKLASKTYGKVYIMLGINEVANDIEYTMSSFRNIMSLVKAYQPDAVIYLQANLHVTYSAQTASITNDGINNLNYRISQLADEFENSYFIDINEVFDDEYGNLTAEFTSDGIHVFGKYYDTWCTWLCDNTVIDQYYIESSTEIQNEEPQEEAVTEYQYQEEPVYEDYGYYENYDNSYYYDDGGYIEDNYGYQQ
ncbi:MAG: hypothetical protein MJ081_07155 [Ruminococcus sp.]|nr:hypothetical protein [Ruminococcus sp.]